MKEYEPDENCTKDILVEADIDNVSHLSYDNETLDISLPIKYMNELITCLVYCRMEEYITMNSTR